MRRMSDVDAATQISDLIRRELKATGRTQEWLGAEMAHQEGRDKPYAQGDISNWLTGYRPWTIERLALIERAMGMRPGRLTQFMGYLPLGVKTTSSVPDAIEADPRLSPDQREMLLAAYRAAVGRRR